MSDSIALELLDIRKAFAGVVALDGVSVRLAGGTVHGLLGENGAGKSTLMNVAYGMLRPDGGEIRVAGRPAALRSPRDALALGIGMVHQHFALAPALSVLDNVLLGDARLQQVLPRKQLAEKLAAMAQEVGLPIEPWARVESLSVGRQQRVEILKALWRDARVLILDEPTAVLTPIETDQLFAAVERLRAGGRTIVFISHKLGEVVRLCDHLTVLRRGRVAFDGPARGLTPAEIAGHMVGKGIGDFGFRIADLEKETANSGSTGAPPRISPPMGVSAPGEAEQSRGFAVETTPSATPLLELDSICAGPLSDVSLTLAPGTITGIAGVDGNGQQELAEVIVGLRRPGSGAVRFCGADVTRLGAKARSAMGIAHVPNDRKREALATTLSIAENVVLKAHAGRPISRWGWMGWGKARAAARELVKRFDVRTPSERTPAGTLSGGNQQKVVLARELALPALLGHAPPRLIVAMNPVRGLDLSATRFVYESLKAARDAGAAVLLISSELDELLEWSDRVGVLYSGKLTMTAFPKTTRDEVGRMMAGVGIRANS